MLEGKALERPRAGSGGARPGADVPENQANDVPHVTEHLVRVQAAPAGARIGAQLAGATQQLRHRARARDPFHTPPATGSGAPSTKNTQRARAKRTSSPCLSSRSATTSPLTRVRLVEPRSQTT